MCSAALDVQLFTSFPVCNVRRYTYQQKDVEVVYSIHLFCPSPIFLIAWNVSEMIYERKVEDDDMHLGRVLCQQSVMDVILLIYLV
jgi:hypothetical protein